MTEEEFSAMVIAEEKRLGVNSQEFLERHNEIMERIELLMKERRRTSIWKIQ